MVEDYADYLVSVALRRLKAPPLPALTFGHRRSHLFQRVMMLVERRHPLERRCCGSWSCMLSGSALLLAFAVSTLRLDAEEATNRTWGQPLAPSATATYHGWVYDDETGRPLEGAMVVVRRRDAGAAEDRVLQESLHVTDVAGHYSFALLPEHLANVWLFLEFDVGHPQYASKTGISCSLDSARQMDAFGGQSAVASIRLRRGEETTGIVESADGRPAAGVTVVAYSQADAPAANSGSFSRTQTDADGHFRILLTASSDGVLCVQSPDGMPLVFLIHQQRGDLGRLRLPLSVAQQYSSHDVAQLNSPQRTLATLAGSP
jgi:5-hydroxyisourate hydrolase-like protein (transthyretin family)